VAKHNFLCSYGDADFMANMIAQITRLNMELLLLILIYYQALFFSLCWVAKKLQPPERMFRMFIRLKSI